jgi:hypothetical protein
MYVENKSAGLDGEGRIGWVELSRTGRTSRLRVGAIVMARRR